MSRGYGVAQRRILAQLAETGESWTPLIKLAVPDGLKGDLFDWHRSEVESTRRAVAKLAAARVVETRLMKRKTWLMTKDESKPGAVSRTHIGMAGRRKGELITTWVYPVRHLGQTQLHVRLVQS